MNVSLIRFSPISETVDGIIDLYKAELSDEEQKQLRSYLPALKKQARFWRHQLKKNPANVDGESNNSATSLRKSRPTKSTAKKT
jgi:hypothetical protein